MKNKFFILNVILFFILLSCKKEKIRWELEKLPELKNITCTNNTVNDFTISANCSFDGNNQNIETGFCWSLSPNLIKSEHTLTNQHKGEGNFTEKLKWVSTEPIYIKAYAKNNVSTVYSNEIKIEWPGTNQNLPKIKINPVTNLSFFSAQISAEVLSDGGLPVLEKGICISTVNIAAPNIPNNANSTYFINTSSANLFSVNLNLFNNTQYYARAYIKNIAGISYSSGTSTFVTKKFYEIGEIGPGGGLVFFNKTDTTGGWNFLQIAPVDFSVALKWEGNNTNPSNINSTAVGSGYSNTNNIYNFYGNMGNYAAQGCYNHNTTGFTDWFLPSRDELIKIYENLFLNNKGNFSLNVIYWSSSEDAVFKQNAWAVKMSSSVNTSSYPKNSIYKFRPIRRF